MSTPRGENAPLVYQIGFGNSFATEAAPGALPQGRNSPQRPAFGLYAEQLSGSAFTAPRAENRRAWLYNPGQRRVRRAPNVAFDNPGTASDGLRTSDQLDIYNGSPERYNWTLERAQGVDFVDGLVTYAGAGDPAAQAGLAIHLYAADRSMSGRVFYDADGELLIVPQQGVLRLATELGRLDVAPGEIALIPRGVRFRVELEGPSRGYVCENYGA
ncbi:MAG TPA: homogentisate 1,2-dioxygenase, partial [Phenylobacterium sp.]|nr:homogentisate 1,2-dioxygenase [Phenylobacterium sp.]